MNNSHIVKAEDLSAYISEKRNEEMVYTIQPGWKKLTFTFNNEFRVYRKDKVVYKGQCLTTASEVYSNI